MLFSHRLRSSGGTERLIVVTAGISIRQCGNEPPNRVPYLVEIFSCETSAFGGIDRKTIAVTDLRRWGEHELRIYSPLLDSADPSHVSFTFDAIQGSGTVDVRLRDDGVLDIATRGDPIKWWRRDSWSGGLPSGWGQVELARTDSARRNSHLRGIGMENKGVRPLYFPATT